MVKIIDFPKKLQNIEEHTETIMSQKDLSTIIIDEIEEYGSRMELRFGNLPKFANILAALKDPVIIEEARIVLKESSPYEEDNGKNILIISSIGMVGDELIYYSNTNKHSISSMKTKLILNYEKIYPLTKLKTNPELKIITK